MTVAGMGARLWVLVRASICLSLLDADTGDDFYQDFSLYSWCTSLLFFMGGEGAGLSSRGGEETYRCAGKVFWIHLDKGTGSFSSDVCS